MRGALVGPAALCVLSTERYRWTRAHWSDSTNVRDLPTGQDQLVILFVQLSCEYLAAPNITSSLERDIGERDRGLQELSCNIVEAGPFEHFHMVFVTIPVNLQPR